MKQGLPTNALILILAFALASFANVTLTLLSTDPYTNSTSQHQTEVEPDSFSSGSTIVAATQAGRFYDGGSSNIGWATSLDGGKTWANGFLPSLTVFSTPAGTYARVTDPSVAYDAMHGVWLVNSLALNSSVVGAAVLVSRSTDGLHWGSPIPVNVATSGQDFDKDWIVCDNTPASSFYGNCYVEYDDFGHKNAFHMAYSTDGGQNWKESSVPNAAVIGGQPVVQPNGTVVVPIDNSIQTAIGSTVSTNGGLSYSNIVTISKVIDHIEAGNLRSSSLPSAEIDNAGTVYVVWQDCRFRRSCKSNDIVMTTSPNGTTWTPIVRVPIGTTNDTQDNFIPGIAVDKGTSGAAAHIGITFYYYPASACGGPSQPACQLNVGFIASPDGGTSWGSFTQVAGPMALSWLPNTDQGRMVGDYISTSFSKGFAHGLFIVANAPASGGSNCAAATPNCNEALYTNAAGPGRPNGVFLTSSGDYPVPNAAADHAAPQSHIRIR